MKLKEVPSAYYWFGSALIVFAFFVIYTTMYSTGALDTFTIQQQQLLLYRPQTGIDCVFLEWKNIGYIQFMLPITIVLGLICWRLGYRKLILFYLVILLLLGTGIEYGGKKVFEQPIPATLRSGLTTLTCPQMRDHQRPLSQQIMVSLGMWWVAPPPPKDQAGWAQDVARMDLPMINITYESGYPSGHSLRWSFVGMVITWLLWRHIKNKALRLFLVFIGIIITFGGGFIEYYVGVHLITEVIAGYLLGIASGCTAVGLLLISRVKKPVEPSVPLTRPEATDRPSGMRRQAVI